MWGSLAARHTASAAAAAAAAAAADNEWLSLLLKSEVFLYCGHQGGEQFIDVSLLQRCLLLSEQQAAAAAPAAPAAAVSGAAQLQQPRQAANAAVLLCGCSSAQLRSSNNEGEPSGTCLDYLTAGW